MYSKKEIGAKIREKRETKRISREKLAEKLMVAPDTIKKWEKGIRTPDIFMLETIAVALDCDLNEFFKKDKNKKRQKLLAI